MDQEFMLVDDGKTNKFTLIIMAIFMKEPT